MTIRASGSGAENPRSSVGSCNTAQRIEPSFKINLYRICTRRARSQVGDGFLSAVGGLKRVGCTVCRVENGIVTGGRNVKHLGGLSRGERKQGHYDRQEQQGSALHCFPPEKRLRRKGVGYGWRILTREGEERTDSLEMFAFCNALRPFNPSG